MGGNERFRNLAEYRAERQRWAQASEHHAQRLHGYAARLKDPAVRQDLMREALGGMLRGALPQGLSGAMTGAGFGGVLQMALGRGQGSLAKRALLFGIGLVAPTLLAKVEQLPLRTLINEVGISLERIKNYLRTH